MSQAGYKMFIEFIISHGFISWSYLNWNKFLNISEMYFVGWRWRMIVFSHAALIFYLFPSIVNYTIILQLCFCWFCVHTKTALVDSLFGSVAGQQWTCRGKLPVSWDTPETAARRRGTLTGRLSLCLLPVWSVLAGSVVFLLWPHLDFSAFKWAWVNVSFHLLLWRYSWTFQRSGAVSGCVSLARASLFCVCVCVWRGGWH